MNGRRILDRVTFCVKSGDFVGLIGPNGGGKTSLIRVLLGLVRRSGGSVEWGRVNDRGVRLGYVPQRNMVDRSYPLNCREVVLQGAPGRGVLLGASRREMAGRADALLERFRLGRHSGTVAAELSGGQQRRMLLARAMMSAPDVLLLDEPTAGVDSEGQAEFCVLLKELCRAGTTVLLVSHDIPLVTEHADRIACLAVQLHWHGAAGELSDEIVRSAYACELDRYQTGHRHVHCAGHGGDLLQGWDSDSSKGGGQA